MIEVVGSRDEYISADLFFHTFGEICDGENHDRRTRRQTAPITDSARRAQYVLGCSSERNQNQIGWVGMNPRNRVVFVSGRTHPVAIAPQERFDNVTRFLGILHYQDADGVRRYRNHDSVFRSAPFATDTTPEMGFQCGRPQLGPPIQVAEPRFQIFAPESPSGPARSIISDELIDSMDLASKQRRKTTRITSVPAADSEIAPAEDPLPRKLSIGIGWSSHFQRPGLQSLFYRKLRYAYRAPALFMEAMLADNARIKFLRFDEDLLPVDFDGTSDQLAESVDLVYFASHGEYRAHSYSLILHGADWKPCTKGLGTSSLSVAVFDTCDLLDLNDSAWQSSWVSSVGPHLRLLLGFASPATVATDSTARGRAFAAKIIGGDPLGPAWLQAVHGTAYAGADLGVAIGFGDDAADADWALHDMTLVDLPRRRKSSSPPTILVEACH